MKKMISLIFVVMVVLSLVSCVNTTGGGNDIENYGSIEASSNVTDSKTDFSETVSSSFDEIISSNEVYESSASVMVWTPETGTKYHSNSSCSGMKNPTQVTKERAIGLGYDPCSRCH